MVFECRQHYSSSPMRPPPSRHREAAGRGDPGWRLPSVTVVLQARAAPQPAAALDCRVGLRPPRNDAPKNARRASPSASSRGRRPWRSSAALCQTLPLGWCAPCARPPPYWIATSASPPRNDGMGRGGAGRDWPGLGRAARAPAPPSIVTAASPPPSSRPQAGAMPQLLAGDIFYLPHHRHREAAGRGDPVRRFASHRLTPAPPRVKSQPKPATAPAQPAPAAIVIAAS